MASAHISTGSKGSDQQQLSADLMHRFVSNMNDSERRIVAAELIKFVKENHLEKARNFLGLETETLANYRKILEINIKHPEFEKAVEAIREFRIRHYRQDKRGEWVPKKEVRNKHVLNGFIQKLNPQPVSYANVLSFLEHRDEVDKQETFDPKRIAKDLAAAPGLGLKKRFLGRRKELRAFIKWFEKEHKRKFKLTPAWRAYRWADLFYFKRTPSKKKFITTASQIRKGERHALLGLIRKPGKLLTLVFGHHKKGTLSLGLLVSAFAIANNYSDAPSIGAGYDEFRDDIQTHWTNAVTMEDRITEQNRLEAMEYYDDLITPYPICNPLENPEDYHPAVNNFVSNTLVDFTGERADLDARIVREAAACAAMFGNTDPRYAMAMIHKETRARVDGEIAVVLEAPTSSAKGLTMTIDSTRDRWLLNNRDEILRWMEELDHPRKTMYEPILENLTRDMQRQFIRDRRDYQASLVRNASSSAANGDSFVFQDLPLSTRHYEEMMNDPFIVGLYYAEEAPDFFDLENSANASLENVQRYATYGFMQRFFGFTENDVQNFIRKASDPNMRNTFVASDHPYAAAANPYAFYHDGPARSRPRTYENFFETLSARTDRVVEPLYNSIDAVVEGRPAYLNLCNESDEQCERRYGNEADFQPQGLQYDALRFLENNRDAIEVPVKIFDRAVNGVGALISDTFLGGPIERQTGVPGLCVSEDFYAANQDVYEELRAYQRENSEDPNRLGPEATGAALESGQQPTQSDHIPWPRLKPPHVLPPCSDLSRDELRPELVAQRQQSEMPPAQVVMAGPQG